MEGPVGSKYKVFGSNQIFGKDGVKPVTINGVELWKIPKGSIAGIESVVTVSNVNPTGQYRVNIVGLNYAENLALSELGGLTFTAKTFDVPYKTPSQDPKFNAKKKLNSSD